MPGPAEVAAMRRAVLLAERGEPATKPNPSVGCVVLDASGQTVGEGWHAHAGGPHAEVVALDAAGDRARGGTAVVTLEPCAHTGRTGPCTEALLAAGIARVVYAVADPTAEAGGGGLRLREAGLDVEADVLADEATRVNARWLTATRQRRPYTTWKYAASLDGRVAAVDGTSRWISGPEARAEVHRMRTAHDCIVAGVGTVLADDPHLTAREPDGSLAAAQPLRVVVDSHGRTPPSSRVLDDAAPTWVVTTGEVGSGPDGRVDLRALMAALHAKGHQDAFVEGGPTLAGALVAAGLVDRVVAYVSPLLLGEGPLALGPAGVPTLAAAPRLDLDEVTRVGGDVRLVGRPRLRGED